jgi:hypothetical protein
LDFKWKKDNETIYKAIHGKRTVFFAESYVKYWMTYDKKVNDYRIMDTIKNYQNTVSYNEAKEIIFNSEVYNVQTEVYICVM